MSNTKIPSRYQIRAVVSRILCTQGRERIATLSLIKTITTAISPWGRVGAGAAQDGLWLRCPFYAALACVRTFVRIIKRAGQPYPQDPRHANVPFHAPRFRKNKGGREVGYISSLIQSGWRQRAGWSHLAGSPHGEKAHLLCIKTFRVPKRQFTRGSLQCPEPGARRAG